MPCFLEFFNDKMNSNQPYIVALNQFSSAVSNVQPLSSHVVDPHSDAKNKILDFIERLKKAAAPVPNPINIPMSTFNQPTAPTVSV